MTNTVVALYDDFSTAETVIQELVEQGFAREDISIASNEDQKKDPSDIEDVSGNVASEQASVDKASGIGAGIGGLGGLLVGLGLLAVPGIGQAVVAGPLVTALASASVGAAGGGMAGALVSLGLSEEESSVYAEGVRRGGTLVTVRSDNDQHTNTAVTILNSHNPVNINERMAQWKATGWTGHDVNAEAYSREDVARERRNHQDYTY